MTTIPVDLAQLADAAFDEAQRWPSRSPQRRAASHLWCSMTLPPAKTVAAVKRAVASFGDDHVQAGAVELLHHLAEQLNSSTAAKGTP